MTVSNDAIIHESVPYHHPHFLLIAGVRLNPPRNSRAEQFQQQSALLQFFTERRGSQGGVLVSLPERWWRS